MLLYPNISLCSLQVLQATATWWWWWYMYFLSHKHRNKLVCCQLMSLWCVQVQLVLEIQVTWGKIKVSLHCCWVFDVCLVFRGSRGSFEDHFEAATINQWVASCQLLDNPFSSRQIFAEELWVLLNTYSLGSRLFAWQKKRLESGPLGSEKLWWAFSKCFDILYTIIGENNQQLN